MYATISERLFKDRQASSVLRATISLRIIPKRDHPERTGAAEIRSGIVACTVG